MADGESGARHVSVDAEGAAGAADERRLARAEIARDGDDVARLELRRPLCGDALGLLRRGRLASFGHPASTLSISSRLSTPRYQWPRSSSLRLSCSYSLASSGSALRASRKRMNSRHLGPSHSTTWTITSRGNSSPLTNLLSQGRSSSGWKTNPAPAIRSR